MPGASSIPEMATVEKHSPSSFSPRSGDPMTAEVEQIDPLTDPRWAELVGSDSKSSVFHSVAWLKSLRDAYGYEVSGLCMVSSLGLLGSAIPVCRVKSWVTGRRLVALPFADHCEFLGVAGDVGRFCSHLAAEVQRETWKYAEVRSISRDLGAAGGFEPAQKYYFHEIDLRAPERELYASLHKDCVQRKIRRAEREGLDYKSGHSSDLLNDFYKLVVLTRRRQGLPPQPIKWFRTLAANFGDQLQVRLAYQSSRPVAGILTLSHKKVLTYKYGASDERFHKLGGMAFLFWMAMLDAKQRGMERLDLGRSDLQHEGLIAFKEHLGGVRTTGSYLRYPPQAPTAEGWKGRLASRVFAHTPPRLLVAAGNILYPHIG